MGLISKAHGIKGEVFVKTSNTDVDWPELKVLFLERDSGLFSFTIESYKPHKSGWIFKLKEVNDRNKSEELVGCSVFLSQAEFKHKEDGVFYLSEIKDFSVITEEGRDLGSIKGFSLNKSQDLILVQKDETSIIPIPFVQEYILDISFENKKIILKLPENFLKEFK